MELTPFHSGSSSGEGRVGWRLWGRDVVLASALLYIHSAVGSQPSNTVRMRLHWETLIKVAAGWYFASSLGSWSGDCHTLAVTQETQSHLGSWSMVRRLSHTWAPLISNWPVAAGGKT
jgi:hypothetical protein